MPVLVLLFSRVLTNVVIGLSSLMNVWPKPPLSLSLKWFTRVFRRRRLRLTGPVIGINLTMFRNRFRALSLVRCPPSLYVACTFGSLLVRRSVRTQIPCVLVLQ